MKILKIFGIVVGIHVFALILIFANPGCSAMSKSPPASAPATPDPAAKADAPSPTITVPGTTGADATAAADASAPAIYVPAGIRYSPTRPGTPAAGVLEAEPVADVTPATTYTVVKGDSLWTVAHKNHLSKAELAAANNLKPEATIRVGQKLLIPGGAVANHAAETKVASAGPATAAGAEAAPAPKGPADSVRHVVKPGEKLGTIAKKYQVTVGEIATANNISDPNKIRPGTELIIPGWQTPAGKSAKSGAKGAAKGAVKGAADTAKPASIPTISVSGAEPNAVPGAKPATDAPPVITVEDAPPPKKP